MHYSTAIYGSVSPESVTCWVHLWFWAIREGYRESCRWFTEHRVSVRTRICRHGAARLTGFEWCLVTLASFTFSGVIPRQHDSVLAKANFAWFWFSLRLFGVLISLFWELAWGLLVRDCVFLCGMNLFSFCQHVDHKTCAFQHSHWLLMVWEVSSADYV